MDKISVIIPVYGAEKTLSKCLESVMQQTYQNFELLLIDDGSPDRSGAICDEWAGKDARIRVFHQSNAGVSDARNKGLEQAEGKYICFVDSDDWVEPNYLHALYTSLLPDISQIGLIIHSYTQVTTDGKKYVRELMTETLLRKDFKEAFIKHKITTIGFPWSKLYQADVLKKYSIRFNENIHCCEDLLFMLKYLSYCDYIHFANYPYYVYNVFPGSLSKRVYSFASEYECFTSYIRILLECMSRYNLPSESIPEAFELGLILLERTLKANYLSPIPIEPSVRIKNLKRLLGEEANYKYIYNHYKPVYKIDRIGRVFLMRKYARLYDTWISMMFRLNVQRMFLGPAKKLSV